MGTSSAAGWRMVAIIWLAQNCATGISSAAYGTAMTRLQIELDTTRSLVSAGIAVMYFTFALLSPLVGHALRHFRVRTVMAVGAGLNVSGYLLMWLASDISQILLSFAVLVGPGVALMGPVPAAVLVSRWFTRNRGKALGIANMPLLLLVAPPVAAWLVNEGGARVVFLALAILFAAIVPLIWQIREWPPAAHESAAGSAPIREPGTGSRRLLGDPRFWMLNMGIGLITGAGTTYVTHAVPVAISKGFDLASSSSLISAFGLGALFGAIVFGWLIDRLGAFPAILINCGAQVLLWMLVAVTPALPVLLLLSLLIGCCLGSAVALHGATLSELFGVPNLNYAMGFSYLLKMPFLFACAPLAGHLFDRTGSYFLPLALTSASLALSFLLFLLIWLGQRGQPQPETIAGSQPAA